MNSVIYHYTDPDSLAEIEKAGLIRAQSVTAHWDMIPRPGRSTQLPAAVWCTINPIADMTVVAKLRVGGFSIDRLCRIVMPYDDTGLGDWCDKHAIPYEQLLPIVQTGDMIGSNYTTWRLVDRDIPQNEWIRVERNGAWLPDHL